MLQFITHRNGRYDEISGTRAVLEGGCRWVQLRMKDAPDEEFLRVGREVGRLCREYGATFLVDDRVHLVAELGADGVHPGQARHARFGSPPTAARRDDHRRDGQYVRGDRTRRSGRGRLHRTGPVPLHRDQTQPEPDPRAGGLPGDLRAVPRGGDHASVVAIGGITAADVAAILDTGATGIALSGALLGAEDPAEETRKIMKILNHHKL